MTDEQKQNAKTILKQTGKNIAAAGVGSAVGYYGGGLLTKKLLSSARVQRDLAAMSKAQRKALRGKVNALGNIAGMAGAGLTSIAMHNALNKQKDTTAEKTAQFCILFAQRNLL